MDMQALRAFGFFMAANFQAVLFIGVGFELVSYLEENYSDSFPWAYIVWPVCVMVIGHLYYLMARQIMKSEPKRKSK